MAVSKNDSKGDFFKLRDHDKHINICTIIARDKKDNEVGRRDIKVPKLNAPLSVWVEFFGGEEAIKKMLVSDYKISTRASIKSAAKSKSSGKRGSTVSALS